MRRHPLKNWQAPLATVLAMAITIGLVALMAPYPGALVLGGVLAMSFSRNRLAASWRGRAEAAVLLPVLGLATFAVGELLKHWFWLGAITYVLVMSASIWLRRFGPLWTRIGSLLALPLITLLIVPGAGAQTTPLMAISISLVALAVVVAVQLLAQACGLGLSLAPPRATEKEVPSAGSLRPIASTRMAIQLALALAAAFVLGWWLFPSHLTWVVLTAFLVCSGNRGRADVLYKSGLRVLGAAAGTLIAVTVMAPAAVSASSLEGPKLLALLLAVIGIGLWLREWNYAAWALVMTLVIGLLQGPAHALTASGGVDLWSRMLAIVVGAACGLCASWFVLPVRSEPVVRKRIAEALAALSEWLAERSVERSRHLDAMLARLDEIAAPWLALERLTRWRATARKPGQWIKLVHECTQLARAKPEASGKLRRTLGETRKALRDPTAIGPALAALHEALLAG